MLYKKEATKGPQFDIAESNWVSDVYFDPFYFLNFLFEGNFDPSVNVAHFDQPAYNNRLRAAAGLTGAARYRGYAGLDADLTTKASPIVVYGNPSRDDLFSARIDCQVSGPYGMDLAALCIGR